MDRYVGKKLDGRYEIREIIGVGGMAVVYKAYDSIEDRIVAVKILKEEYASNDEFLRRFKNESKAIAVLSHPNVVKVFDVSFGDMIQYIVMEYIDGITLKEYIEQRGALQWSDAVHFTIQILRGLQHAHDKGIVHRDVKPQNIMLIDDGTIKVTDFGIARFARSEHKTMTDKAIGSVHYISPEQARGDSTDEKADIYSVGVMLYEMLTGQLPFQAESAVSVAIMQLQSEPQFPREINDTIPFGLEQITMHAMQKDSLKRYQSAAEMLRDLEEFRRAPDMTFEYTYFIDADPTRYIGKLPQENEEKETKAPIIPILAGIAVTFVLGLIIIAVIFLPKLFGPTGDVIDCPKLVGRLYSELQSDKEIDKLLIQEPEYVYSSEHEAGYIIDQRPAAGQQIKTTQKVYITVSMGKKMVTVPDVYDFDIATAVSTLRTAGFITKIVEQENDVITKDRVVSTNPARNQNAYEGGEIEIFISSGAAVVYVDVPNITGLTETVARKQIEAKGLKVGTVTQVDNNMPAGTVVKQDPSPNSTPQVAKGTAIHFSVSTGIPPIIEYNYTLQFDLPRTLTNPRLYIVAWLDGVEHHTSKLIDTSSTSSYSIKFTTEKESAIVRIEFKDESGKYTKYRDYLINFKDSTNTCTNKYMPEDLG